MLKKDLLENYSANLLKEETQASKTSVQSNTDKQKNNENSPLKLLIVSCVILLVVLLFFIVSHSIINLILTFVLTCLYVYQTILFHKNTKSIDFAQITRYICIGLWGTNFVMRLIQLF